jgi:DNA-binding winged helix-turn-helix (wHTH) protein/tetratricopeptide (TPR) repeat protein/TolB-like protein
VSSVNVDVYLFGRYRLEVSRRAVFRGREPVALTPRAFDTLVFLVARRDRAVSRQEILEGVWGDVVVEPGTVDKHVSMLRKALDAETGDGPHIDTVRGFGFRFAADVRVDDAGVGAPPPTPLVVASPSVTDGADRADAAAAARPWRRATALISVLAVVAVSLAFVLHTRAGPGTPTIALLRFHSLGAPAEGDWRSTALREMVSAQLASAGRLHRVLSADVDRALRELGKPADETPGRETIAALHKRLGADYVVTGSWVPSGDKARPGIRVTAALEDPRSGKTLATASEGGPEGDLFGIASQIATRLRERLDLGALTPEERRKLRSEFPADAETSRLYAEALAKLSSFETLAAVERLEKAVARSPDFAPAHEALSDAWEFLGVRPKARDEAAMALALSSRRPKMERDLAEAVLAERSRDGAKAIALYQSLWDEGHDFENGLRLLGAQIEFRRAADARRTLDFLRAKPAPLRDDPRLDLAEGWVRRELSDFRGQLAAGRKAAATGRSLGAGLLVAQAREIESWALETLGDLVPAQEAAEDGWHLAEALGNRRLAAHCLALEAHAKRARGDRDGALALYEKGLAISREIGYRRDDAFLNGIAAIHAERGELAESRRVIRASVEGSREVKSDESLVNGLLVSGQLDTAMGDLTAAAAEIDESVALARRVGVRARLATALLGLGELDRVRGRLDVAHEAFSEATRLLDPVGVDRGLMARLELARVETDAGRPAAALQEARSVRARAEGTSSNAYVPVARAVAAEALLDLGRWREAEDELRGVTIDATQNVPGIQQYYPKVARARIAAAAGRRDEALATLEELAQRVEREGNLSEAAEARLARARLLPEPARRSALETVAADARARGFVGVSARAQRSISPSGM